MATAISSPVSAQVRSPLALWHLLSLDAPTVAVLWTIFFLELHRVAVTPVIPLSLGLAVWMLYAGDRLADAARPAGPLELRHRFHAAHKPAFLGLLTGSLPLLGLLVWMLPPTVRAGWLMMGVPLAGYVAAVHLFRVPRLPKEMMVALLFASVTVLPAAVESHSAPLRCLPQAALFASVCWLNCVAIARWEKPETNARSTAWGALHLRAIAAGALFGSVAIAALGIPFCALACAGSAAALVLLDLWRDRFSTLQLRTLADAALLTPALLWPLLHVHP